MFFVPSFFGMKWWKSWCERKDELVFHDLGPREAQVVEAQIVVCDVSLIVIS